MATCKDCLHDCYTAALADVEETCNFFLDKSEYVKRKRGEWILNEDEEYWFCSECEFSALNNYRGNSARSNFCPTCGADMREVDPCD